MTHATPKFCDPNHHLRGEARKAPSKACRCRGKNKLFRTVDARLIDDLKEQLRWSLDKTRKLSIALHKYGRHDGACAINTEAEGPCSCRFDKVLDLSLLFPNLGT